MIIIINEKQMEKYYVKAVNTYVFEESVKFLFNVNVKANIIAHDIKANDITAHNIKADYIDAHNVNTMNIYALDIKAHNIIAHNIIAHNNINANDISYYAVCVSHNYIFCNSIKGRHRNAKHFVLEGELIVGGK